MHKFVAAIGSSGTKEGSAHLLRMLEDISAHIGSGADLDIEVALLVSPEPMTPEYYNVVKEVVSGIQGKGLMVSAMIEGANVAPEAVISIIKADQITFDDDAAIESGLNPLHPAANDFPDLASILNGKVTGIFGGTLISNLISASPEVSDEQTIRSVPSAKALFRSHVSRRKSVSHYYTNDLEKMGSSAQCINDELYDRPSHTMLGMANEVLGRLQNKGEM